MLDPGSTLAAAFNEWKHPASLEWMMLANLFDLTLRLHAKNGKPMPRPWDVGSNRVGGSVIRSRQQVDDILNKMNPARSKHG